VQERQGEGSKLKGKPEVNSKILSMAIRPFFPSSFQLPTQTGQQLFSNPPHTVFTQLTQQTQPAH